jgi:hypothetical protein
MCKLATRCALIDLASTFASPTLSHAPSARGAPRQVVFVCEHGSANYARGKDAIVMRVDLLVGELAGAAP